MTDYPEGMPCWATGAAEFLETLLNGREMAIEWGGGASSVWLVDRVRYVFVIEHDPEWVRWIEERMPKEGNRYEIVSISFEDDRYVNWPKEHAALAEAMRADMKRRNPESGFARARRVWLVDGYRRIDVIKVVVEMAEKGDIVVLDDAMDYAEHLLDGPWKIERFKIPHPHAGVPLTSSKHKVWRNSVRKTHALYKETWVCVV